MENVNKGINMDWNKFRDKLVSPLDIFGFSDKDAPDISAYEGANDEIIKELKGKVPQKYQELDPNSLRQLGPSTMEGISTDPAMRAAQMKALQRMQEIGDKGYTIEEEAAMNRMQSQNAQADRSRREAIQQNMQARGMADSGASLAMQLASNQAANQDNSQQSQDIAANAQRRALQAMAQSGSMAGNMRQQEFGEKGDIARARDAVNQFNTTNAVNVQERNNQGQNNFTQQQFQNNAKIAELGYNQNSNKANSKTGTWAHDQEMKDKRREQILNGGAKVAAAYAGGK